MSKAKIDQILSGEMTTKEGSVGEKGTGLGLILVQELAHLNNGLLRIESTKGEGSTFMIEVPRREEA